MPWRVTVPVLLLSIALLMAIVPAVDAQSPAPPSAQISNGEIVATVYLPDKDNGFYRGTRFDWSGVIGRLEHRGHVFYDTWFTSTDPTVRDFVNDGTTIVAGPQTAVTGPAEEFSGNLGYAEAAPGGTFIKIGVGVLRKPTDGSDYSAFRSYELVDEGEWTVVTRPDGIDFTQALTDAATGYGYLYTKTLRLVPGRAELVMEHRLENRGDKAIASTVYNHNFLNIDGQAPGPDYVLKAQFDLTSPRPIDPAVATVQGRELTYVTPLVGTARFSTPLEGFGPTAADYRFAIENRRAGAGVEVIGDRPLSRLALWSIRAVMCLEPFLAINIEPGADFTWQYTYSYYTIP